MRADISSLIERIRAGLPPIPARGASEFSWQDRYADNPAIRSDERAFIALLDPDNIRRLLDHIAELEARTEWRPTHRHKKRRSTYQLDGYGEVQTDAPIGDYCKVAIYRAEDGTTWVRPVTEFEDGRFEPLPTSPGGRDNG